MPCYEPPMSYEERRRYSPEGLNEKELEAVLCGVLTTVGAEVFDYVNWKEVGVPKDFAENWWKAHQKKDAKRRKKEK